MSQTNQPSQPSAPSRNPLRMLTVVGLVLVTVLSLAYVGYNALNPHVMTATQQQFVTNTQNLYVTQTVTSLSTATSATTVMAATTPGGFGPPNQQGCGMIGGPQYCAPPRSSYLDNYHYCNIMYGSTGNVGNSGNVVTGNNNTVRCYGYLNKDSNGCIELVVPITSPYYAESPVYQYYSLQNLPSNYPSVGSWVTVSGQVYQGFSGQPSGAACPSSYINVSSISQ